MTSISRPWRFDKILSIDSNDVIIGDIAKQNYTVVGIDCHVGVRLPCKKCGNEFSFSAKEQQHWYEILRFWADSVSIECINCRGVTRAIKDCNKKLSIVLAKDNITIEDCDEIVAIALKLIGNGVKVGGGLGQKIIKAARRSDLDASSRLIEIINTAQQVDSAEASTIAVPPSEPPGSPR